MKKATRNVFCLIVLVMFVMAGASFSASALEGILGKVYKVYPANEPYGIKLTWNSVDDAESYNIYRRQGEGESKFIARVEGTQSTEYFDDDLISGKRYYYRVKAVNSIGEGDLSDEKRRTFIASPQNYKAESKNGYLRISWDSVTGADEYFVYRKSGNGKWTKIGSSKNTTPYFNDKNVKNNTVYSYAVVTHDGNGLSTMDEKGFNAEYMAAPTGFTLKNVSNNIRFTWKKVSGAERYIVYRKDTVNKKWVRLATTKSTSYTDSTVKNGSQYYYTVRADGDDGGLSTYITSKKYSSVYNLTGVKVVNKPGAVRISWNKSNAATSYRVYREEKGEWVRISVIKNKSTTYFDDKSVKDGKTYKYTVLACRGSDLGDYNKSGYKALYYSAPKLTLQYSPKGVSLKWSKAKSGKSYTVYYKGEGQSAWTALGVISNINTVAYTHKTPLYGRKNTYFIRVNGAKTRGDSYTASIYGIDPTKKMVALTYDDGPSSDTTNRILNTLNKYNSRATFFVVGNRVNSYKNSIKKAVNQGCEIGNHSYSHTILTKVGADTIRSQINKTNSVVKSVTGVTPKIVRTPGGAVNSTVRNNVKYPIISWSVDTLDWKNRNASSVVSAIKRNVKDGSIVLMHDLYGSTATATEQIVPWLVKNGYQIVTVSELMQLKGVNMKAGTVYYSAS